MKNKYCYIERFGDAIQLLCNGNRPSNKMLMDWLDCDDHTLQDFACSNGPEWAQGIVLIDAARLLAEIPIEGSGFYREERKQDQLFSSLCSCGLPEFHHLPTEEDI
jgi:hypothetical protein